MLRRNLPGKLTERLAEDTRGNVLVIASAGMFALVGGAGLGTDTIQWFLWKRQVQLAVDAGALAGAHALTQGVQDATAPASKETRRNSNTTLTIEEINKPPTSGAYAGSATAVEVIASTTEVLPFSGLFLSTPPIIRARSVAALVKGGDHCVIALADNGSGVNVSGGGKTTLGCGVAANSAGARSIYLEGSSYLEASPLTAVGGISGSTSNYPAAAQVNAYSPPQADPLKPRNLQVPSSPSSCSANNFVADPNKPPVTLYAGRYCNGMTLKGDVTLSPGVYLVDKGSFYVSSQAKVTGKGVTIILTGSSSSDIAVLKIEGGATVDLTPPTPVQDPYWKNILLFQDPRAAAQLSEIQGGSTLNLQGITYFPKGDLRFAGGAGTKSECLFLVANRITFTGSTSIANTCSSDFDNDFASRSVKVVE